MTFGLKRAEILSAQVNGATLLVLSGLILYESIHRLISPPMVSGWTMLLVALVGVAVNLLATWQLAKANRENMAIEGSFQHIVTDLYAFIGTLVAAVVILASGFNRADAIASLLVVALMLRSAYGLLKNSGRVLLEAAPAGTRVEEGWCGTRRSTRGDGDPRPPHLGDRLGVPGLVSARLSASRRGLPWYSPRTRAPTRRPFPDRPYNFAGRSREERGAHPDQRRDRRPLILSESPGWS